MIDLMDLVRSIAAEAARAEENTNYPLPCTPGSPLLASVRQACVERGYTTGGLVVPGAAPQTAVAKRTAYGHQVPTPRPSEALITAVDGLRKAIHDFSFCPGDGYKAMIEARSRIFAAAAHPVAVPDSSKPIAPAHCPISGRKFWGNIDHPERGLIATYGGPFDTYSIPYLSDDNELRVECFDQDSGEWVEGGAPCGWYSNEQPHAAPAAQGDAKDTERLRWLAETGARISWSMDGEYCAVWLPDERDGTESRPAEGYPLKCYDSWHRAIDAAIATKAVKS